MTLRPYLLLVLALIGCGGSAASAPPLWTRPGFEGAVRPEMGPPQPGDAAPEIDLPIAGSDTDRYRLSARRGRWVVVHFTTTWCPFCDEEVEHLDRLAADYASRNVDTLLIDVLEERDRWRTYLEGRLPAGKLWALSDVDGGVARRYAPPRVAGAFEERAHVVLASTLVIDPDGIVRLFLLADSERFDPTFAAVRERLDELLAERSAGATPVDERQDDEVRSPAEVVTIAVSDPGPVVVGDRGELRVTLSIASGYHLMSNPPSKPNYIPTTLQLEAEGIQFGTPVFPPFTRFQLWDEVIDTLQGDATVGVPFQVSSDAAAGTRAVNCKVEYQACTEGSCLFPFTQVVSFSIQVAATI